MGISLSRPKTINKVVLIDVDRIKPNRNQPRTMFNQRELEGLSESILANGMLQPITVRKEESSFELIAGERRLRAAKLANLKNIPCIVIETTVRQAAVFALIENLQREDLNYFDEAVALRELIVEWGISQVELGEKLGKAQSTIANKLRLLKYDDCSRQIMLGNNITERQARALLKIEDDTKLFEAIDYISANKLSSAQTEQYIEAILKAKKALPKRNYKPVVKDVRIFINTINNAIKLMNQSGIQASAQKIDSDDCIEYVVKIPLHGGTITKIVR